jgi:FHA domain
VTGALRLAPGSGVVSRRPGALLFAKSADKVLVDAFATSPPGAEMQALASATVATGFEVGPFVCLTWDGGLRVMAFGDIAIETDQPSLPMLSGAGSRTWVEHTVALSGGRAVIEVTGDATDPATDLVDGTVFAGAFRLELGEPAHAVAPPVVEPELAPAEDATASVPRVEPAPEPAAHAVEVPVDPDDPVAALAAIQAAAVGADGEPLQRLAVSPVPPPDATPEATWAADDEAPDPDVTLPPPVSEVLLADVRGTETTDGRGSLVDAKLCPAGHANPPTAATCALCGESLSPGSMTVVHVPRPSLGRLQLDDGDLVELDQELLVGRNPDRDNDPSRARMRRLRTPGDKVSRTHLEVRFQGWDVLVADCGSTNGTFVVAHPGGQVAALETGRPQMVEPGAVVYFGSRSFTVLGRSDG